MIDTISESSATSREANISTSKRNVIIFSRVKFGRIVFSIMIELGMKIPQNCEQEKKTIHECIFSKIYPFLGINVKRQNYGTSFNDQKKDKKNTRWI